MFGQLLGGKKAGVPENPVPSPKIMQFLQRPEVMAYLAQSTASLLQGEGFAKSAGQGIGAIGRMKAGEAAQAEKQKDRDLEERRVAAYERSIDMRGASGGGGGGGSSGSGSSTDGLPSLEDLAKDIYKQEEANYKAAMESYTAAAELALNDPTVTVPQMPQPPSMVMAQQKAQRVLSAMQRGMSVDKYYGLPSDIRDSYANDWNVDGMNGKPKALELEEAFAAEQAAAAAAPVPLPPVPDAPPAVDPSRVPMQTQIQPFPGPAAPMGGISGMNPSEEIQRYLLQLNGQ